MPIVDLGVDFDEVKDMDQFEVLDSGTYEFQVRNVDVTQTGETSKTPGRPMLKWELEIIGHPTANGRRLFYNTVLPWVNPAKPGERDTSGCGLLVAIAKGVGKPWTGGQINTDEYLGLTGFVEVGQGTIKGGPRKGEPTNTVKIVVPKG